MDENVRAEKVTEQRDGFSQLAEKMEQVRTQMIKMERKYDELYKAVKEKESKTKTPLIEESKSTRVSTAETMDSTRSSLTTDIENMEKVTEAPKDETIISTEPDIEKLEDNPFM